MAASCRIRRSGSFEPFKECISLNGSHRFPCVLSKLSLDSTFLYGRYWLCRLRSGFYSAPRWGRAAAAEHFTGPISCSGAGNGRNPCPAWRSGSSSSRRRSAVSGWLCRIIPNPTVLAIFALKLLLIAGALLNIPGAPSFGLLSSLGGMVFCFLVFSAPALMGKQVGAGDIKLAAAMGFLLGFGSSLLAVPFMGLLILGCSMVQRQMPLLAFLKTDIPMGPFIAAGMMITCVVPYITL